MRPRSGTTKLLAVVMAVGMVAALLLMASPTARAQIGDQPTIRSIALGPGPQPGTELLATVGEKAGQNGVQNCISLKVLGAEATSSAFGVTTFFPNYGTVIDGVVIGGSESDPPFPPTLFVLDSAFRVHSYQVSAASDGPLRISGPTTQGPFGDPRVDGNPKALARAPNPPNATDPWLAIGTDSGRLILIRGGRRPEHLDLAGPIVDLAVIPQVGYVAFVALVNGRDDHHLVGIRPPDPIAETGGQVVWEGHTLFNDLGLLRPGDPLELNEPTDVTSALSEPAPVDLLIANGTRFIHRLTIPAEPTIGGTFRVRSLEAADVPIAQAAVGSGSLALLPVDGAGVLHDPGFRIDRGGVSGKLLTVFGSSLEVRPRNLSLQGRRRLITGLIEVAGNNASNIQAGTISVDLGVGGGIVSADAEGIYGDADGDGILDLKVKFDLAAVLPLVPASATSVLVTARWLFRDGSRGSASAELRIKSEGDDEDEDGS